MPTLEADSLFSSIGIPPPPEAIDLEARGAEYLAEAIASTRKAYWHERTPPTFRQFDRDHPNLRPNVDNVARALAWQFHPKGLLLSGPTNTGKSRTLFALCRRLLCEEKRDVGIFTAQEFFVELNNCVQFGRDEAAGFIKRQSERPVFFLDDYGQEALLNSREAWAQQWFFNFLDRRRGLGLPLLVTMNLTAQEIAGHRGSIHGDPLITRLLDVAEPLKFSAPALRRA